MRHNQFLVTSTPSTALYDVFINGTYSNHTSNYCRTRVMQKTRDHCTTYMSLKQHGRIKFVTCTVRHTWNQYQCQLLIGYCRIACIIHMYDPVCTLGSGGWCLNVWTSERLNSQAVSDQQTIIRMQRLLRIEVLFLKGSYGVQSSGDTRHFVVGHHYQVNY